MNAADMIEATIEAPRAQADVAPDDLDHADWERTRAVSITR